MLHMWEEPCISGKNGSGAIFFSGCPLKCVFCQNKTLSADSFGMEITIERLAEIMLELRDGGAANINLVSPTQYAVQIKEAVSEARQRGLDIPIVYNTGGYELSNTIELLKGTVDIYLTDVKYFSDELAQRYSHAPDYHKYAIESLKSMVSQIGRPVFDENGMMKKGVIVRHLVLPTHRSDSKAVLESIRSEISPDMIKLSLMSQYTPNFAPDEFHELKRRVTTFEYNYVVDTAQKLGFDGYMQERSSAYSDYTPVFDLSGII